MSEPEMHMKTMSEVDMCGKHVLIRQDLNAPTVAAPASSIRKITSTQRLDAALEGARLARDAGAKVMLMSHVGRPREGEFASAFSLAPMAEYLSEKLESEVRLCADYLRHSPQPAEGEVVLLENVRFNPGESVNNTALAKKYADLCDIFVMDAFGAAHRAQASTHGVVRHAKTACAGPLFLAEIDALKKVMDAPRRPMVAVVGGSKVSTKLNSLKSLAMRADQLIPGGGIANTLLKAAGHNVGKSLIEPDLAEAARELLRAAAMRGNKIALPEDVVTAKELSADATAETKLLSEIAADDMILDIGPATIARYQKYIARAGTVLWNGPLGVFEHPQFAAGTEAIGRAIAASGAFSVAGGGDTLAATERFGISKKISCVSTGGGAFLEFLEGKHLPALAALELRESHGRRYVGKVVSTFFYAMLRSRSFCALNAGRLDIRRPLSLMNWKTPS